MTDKKRIAILFGGNSSEYEVSLQSASAVIQNIDREKYQPVLIGITREGEWLYYQGSTQDIRQDCWHSSKSCRPVWVSFDKRDHGIFVMNKEEPFLISLNGALPILHGKNGEDGTVQGVLELAGIPLIGCGTLCSAICMDKAVAHSLIQSAGIQVPQSYTVELEDQDKAGAYAAGLGYPLFVKPLRAGSSFGITKVMQPEELEEALKTAFAYDQCLILEEAIEGFEVGCAILGNRELLIGEVDEIELSQGFFDYTEKYTLKTSQIHVPARISKEKAQEIKEKAIVIYKRLGCRHFARVDMFLTMQGELYFNEVNTIPGFTAHSRYPNMLKETGISFKETVNRILEMAEGV